MKNKSYKKVLAIMLTICMAFSCFSLTLLTANAESKVIFTLDAPDSVAFGEEFTVTVNIANCGNVYAGSLNLDYDNALVEVKGYSYGSVISGDGYVNNYNNLDENVFLSFFHTEHPLTTEGALLNVTFVAKEASEGNADFALSEILLSDENFNSLENVAASKVVAIGAYSQPVSTTVPVTTTKSVTDPTESTAEPESSSAKVTDPTESTAVPESSSAKVTDPTESTAVSVATDPEENMYLYFEEPVNVVAGETFSVDVCVKNADNIYAGNFVVDYDNTKLVLLSYALGELINADENNAIVNEEYSENQFFVSFFNVDTPIVAEGGLITLTFDVKETAEGKVKFNFSEVLFSDENFDDVQCDGKSCEIDIKSKETTPSTTVTTPPTTVTVPPTTVTTPPTTVTVPPTTVTTPPTTVTVPPTTVTTPPTTVTVPPTTVTTPPTTVTVPPTTVTPPPTTVTVPPATETIPPTTVTVPPENPPVDYVMPAELFLTADEFIEGQTACISVGLVSTPDQVVSGTISIEFVDEVLDYLNIAVYADSIDGYFDSTVDEGVITVSFSNYSPVPAGESYLFDVCFDVGNPEYWWTHDVVDWFNADFKFISYELYTADGSEVYVSPVDEYSFEITQTTEATPPYDFYIILLGDSDLDGTVNIKDATLIQKYLANFDVEFGFESMLAANVVNNDDVTIKDVTTIQKYLANYEVEPEIGVEFEYYDIPSTDPWTEPDTEPDTEPGTEPDTEPGADGTLEILSCDLVYVSPFVGDTFTYDLILDCDMIFENIQGMISYDSTKLKLINTSDTYYHCPNLEVSGYQDAVINFDIEDEIYFTASEISKNYDFTDGKVLIHLNFEVIGEGKTEIGYHIEEMVTPDGVAVFESGNQCVDEGVEFTADFY